MSRSNKSAETDPVTISGVTAEAAGGFARPRALEALTGAFIRSHLDGTDGTPCSFADGHFRSHGQQVVDSRDIVVEHANAAAGLTAAD